MWGLSLLLSCPHCPAALQGNLSSLFPELKNEDGRAAKTLRDREVQSDQRESPASELVTEEPEVILIVASQVRFHQNLLVFPRIALMKTVWKSLRSFREGILPAL